MKKRIAYIIPYVVLFVAGFALIPFAVVYAQTATPTNTPVVTATITARPGVGLTPIMTMVDVSDLDCLEDGEVPVGWGTITPSSFWNMECSDCYPNTPYPSETPVNSPTPSPTIFWTPTPTHDGTGTPYPSATPSSTPTITPTPSGQSCEENNYGGGVYQDVHINDWTFTGNWNTDACGKYSSETNAKISYTFTGSAVRLTSIVASNQGIQGVWIDSELDGLWDRYDGTGGPGGCYETEWIIDGLDYEEHTVEVIVTGNKNPASSGVYGEVTKIEYFKTTPDWEIEITSYYDEGNKAEGADWDFFCEQYGKDEEAVYCEYYYYGREDSNIFNSEFYFKLNPNYVGTDTEWIYVRHLMEQTGTWNFGGLDAFPEEEVENPFDYWDTLEYGDDGAPITVADGSHGDPETCNCNEVTVDGQMWVSLYPFNCDPSIPYDPETGDGYCQTIEDFAIGMGGGSGGFYFTGVTYGSDYCVDVGGWSYSILGVGIDIPMIAHICFQDVAIGEIAIFGLAVSLDDIVVLFVAAWALRNLFTS